MDAAQSPARITAAPDATRGGAPAHRMGLSEIAVPGDWAYLIECDNHAGSQAVLRTVTRVPLAERAPSGGTCRW